MNKNTYRFSIKDITEIGILSAAAILLDTFVKIPIFADGGSINVAMIPLIFIALHKGWFKGFIASAIIFGLSTCLLDGYGIHTYPFDYFIAFGGIAVVGAFRNKIIKDDDLTFKNYFYFAFSLFICFAIRIAASTISGIIFYGLNMPASLAYQLTYMIPSFTLTFLLLMPLLKKLKGYIDRLS